MNEFQRILSHLLRVKTLKTPFVAQSPNLAYKESLAQKLDEYIKRIKSLKTQGELTEWLQTQVQSLEKTNQKLLRSVDEYLSGSAGKAYDEIEELMETPHINHSLITLKKPLNIYSNERREGKSLYRVRESDSHLAKREEMFHIPFHTRNYVCTQRYSIAGVPCLYLGSSLYVCWQEMGKPSLNKLHLSHFKINKKNLYGEIFVLDFAFTLETLKQNSLELFQKQDIKFEESKAYLTIWPVLMACSYNAENPGSSFCVEYVIPNLILQWIGKEKKPVSGIMYLSTKTKHLRNSDIGINFVFPPDTAQTPSRGYCEKLSNIFAWSKPVSWQLLNTFNNIDTNNDSTTFRSKSDDIENQLIKNYNSTTFYQMERKLQKLTQLGNEIQETAI